MSEQPPNKGIETRETSALGRNGEGPGPGGSPEKGRATNRSLTIFKSLVLAVLLALTLYGMLNRGLTGLSGVERWLPVAVSILVLLFVALLITNYFAGLSRVTWVLVGLLAALVAVKGLSMTWTISQTDTIQELLRSSMYLATFALAAASLSSRRLVGPLVDGLTLIVAAVAGYGVLQKIAPVQYPPNTPDGVRVGSTLEYANTVAMVLGIGIALGLGRMSQLRNPVGRGLYAALLLVFGAVLYFTFSRGGMLALGAGLAVLFVVGERRLQMFANSLLVFLPLVWLLWSAQDLQTFFTFIPDASLAAADGREFRGELLIAAAAAFVLQAGYALLIGRYELVPRTRRALGVAAIAAVLLGAGSLGYIVVSQQVERGGLFGAFATGIEEPERANERLTSLSSNSRGRYWEVAWEAWKERPLTGTGAGTFHYTWLEDRPDFDGVTQVHNVYLEQGTETGVFAFLALVGFAALLLCHLAWATWRANGERRVLLAGLTGAATVYLVSSALEWHWYILPSTILFFILAGAAATFASEKEWETSDRPDSSSEDQPVG